jgi:hypothetical protein
MERRWQHLTFLELRRLYKSVYPTATAEEVKDALLDGARPTASLNGKILTNGRLDVATSLTLAPMPKISISDEAVIEGDSGTTSMIFTLTLSKASTNTVTVNWATEEDTATANIDYLTDSGSITFAPGELTQTISVTVVGDLEVEMRKDLRVLYRIPPTRSFALLSPSVKFCRKTCQKSSSMTFQLSKATAATSPSTSRVDF